MPAKRRNLVFKKYAEIEIIAGDWYCGNGKNSCPHLTKDPFSGATWFCDLFLYSLVGKRPKRCSGCLEAEHDNYVDENSIYEGY